MVSVGSCPIGKVTWACKLTTHLYQVLGVRLSGSVPLLVLCTFMVCSVTVLPYLQLAGEIVGVEVQSLDFP